MLAARESGLRSSLEAARAEAAATEPESMLARIRAFFGLERPVPGGAA